MTVGTYFSALGTALETDLQSLSGLVENFIETDLGQLSIAAVNYAETLTDTTGDGKRDAAKTQLLNAASAAGKDMANIATSVLNFMIETAFQAVLAGTIAGAAAGV